MKKHGLILLFIVILYYSGAFVFYQFFLPYSVEEGELVLNTMNQRLEIDFHDPEISHRELLVKIRHNSGSPVEIIYTRCSDDVTEVLTQGSLEVKHNFAGNIVITLLDENSSAELSYTIIDRVSFLIPKSATKACTAMPGIVYGINLTIILSFLLGISGIAYILLFKREEFMLNLKKL
jgi:hypothetical protein